MQVCVWDLGRRGNIVIPPNGEQSTDMPRSIGPNIRSRATQRRRLQPSQHRNCLQRNDKLPYLDRPPTVNIQCLPALLHVVMVHNSDMTAPEEETCSMPFDVLAISARGEYAMRT
jgi:hypothetical protein